MNELHAEALQEDKKYKVGEQRKAARSETEALEQKYGGVLGEISRLPLDREPGGATHTILEDYLQREQKIDTASSELMDKKILREDNL